MPSVPPFIDCPDPILRPGAQGIEFVAVDDADARLVVTFARVLDPGEQSWALAPGHWTLTGGQRLFPRIVAAGLYNPPGAPPDLTGRRVALSLDGPGDFSIYTLTVTGPDVDPFFASRRLRFRLACDDAFDCRAPAPAAPPPALLPVTIDYLAKDYASFRQALIDFIATRRPDWTERSEADIGMMLLELLAYAADDLSYLQDRVANEAFLDTASQRRSVAGHLALIGYQLDQGAAAWTWLQFEVNDNATLPAAPGIRVANPVTRPTDTVVVFETLGAATLRPEHNTMTLYDWGNAQCCLPAASLSAALVGTFDKFRPGDWLAIGSIAGGSDVVQLTNGPEVLPADPITARPDGPITIVRWSQATPLRMDHCVADTTVWGNVVPATHGETVTDEPLRQLTTAQQAALQPSASGPLPRQRLPLSRAPLAYLDPATPGLPARPEADSSTVIAGLPGTALRGVSTITVTVGGVPGPWEERATLLESRPGDQVFRVEIDDDGTAAVVFGDDTFGLRPDDAADVTATYRVGGGAVGNVGAGTLTVPRPRPADHLPWLVSVTNPVPATGGRDYESRDHARRFGPATFQQPLVAVTAADYQQAAVSYAVGGLPVVQRADVSFRWTGSWLTATLAVEPRGGEVLDAATRSGLLAYLGSRRLAGRDLEAIPPRYAPLEVEIELCVRAGFVPADVVQHTIAALSPGLLPGGGMGFFSPEQFSFGEGVYLSQLYQAVMAVPGIDAAHVVRLCRQRSPRPDTDTAAFLRRGFLLVASDEIIQLANDRNFPERGTLTVRPRGQG
jgi:hypothetical protein